MKKSRLFAAIIYFLFTFTLGILLAIFLPYFYMFYGESINMIADSLGKEQYGDAMELVGGYFNREPVFLEKFDKGGGIVLFEAATLVSGENDTDGAEIEDGKMHLAYGGFVFDVGYDVYKVSAYKNNQTKLVITDVGGTKRYFEVLNYDGDKDGINDSNATYLQRGFFYVDLDQETYKSIAKITLIDADGKVFAEVSPNLTFSEKFFADVTPFVEEYNRDFNSENLKQLDEEFRGKNENYAMSSTGVAKSNANRKSAIIVVVYFVIIYIIADFILGSHYIIKFFRWFLVKVCKVKIKPRTPKNTELFGQDYFSKVTMALDVDGLDDFSDSVQIRYTSQKGDGEEISFLLMKSQNYTTTQRIKAGTYVNMWIDLDKTVYATQNLPETLVVEGYQKGFKIKIIKREE